MEERRPTKRQVEANRRNARKAKGPSTAAGKARSSRNSEKHQAYSERFHPITWGPLAEDQDAFLAEAEAIASDIRGAGAAHVALADQTAATIMKLRRLDRMEASLLNAETLPDPELHSLYQQLERTERLDEQMRLLVDPEPGLAPDWELIARHLKSEYARGWTAEGLWDNEHVPSDNDAWCRATLALIEATWPDTQVRTTALVEAIRETMVMAETFRRMHAGKVAEKMLARSAELERPRAHLMRQLRQLLDQIRAIGAINDCGNDHR